MGNLMPENDMQELWEQNGRVKAVIAYIKKESHLDGSLILKMLGEFTEDMDIPEDVYFIEEEELFSDEQENKGDDSGLHEVSGK